MLRFTKIPFNTALVTATVYLRIDSPEAATRGVLCKMVFLEISQNSQENTCARVSFLIKSFVKFLRTPFLQNTSSGCFCLEDVENFPSEDFVDSAKVLLICYN